MADPVSRPNQRPSWWQLWRSLSQSIIAGGFEGIIVHGGYFQDEPNLAGGSEPRQGIQDGF
jgi:hypothetical protein